MSDKSQVDVTSMAYALLMIAPEGVIWCCTPPATSMLRWQGYVGCVYKYALPTGDWSRLPPSACELVQAMIKLNAPEPLTPALCFAVDREIRRLRGLRD